MDRYAQSDQWRKLNEELFNAEVYDLSGFKSGALNNRISMWDINQHALRYCKTLLFNTAKSLTQTQLQLLDRIVSIYPEHVPPNSLLREFIGGSGFEF